MTREDPANPGPDIKLPDPALIGRSMADVASRSQRLVQDWLRRQAEDGMPLDPLNVGGAFFEMTARMLANPQRLLQAQLGYWQDAMTLWQNTTRRMMGVDAAPVIETDPKDKRFKDEAWRQNEVFDFIKQSYLLSARFMQDVITRVDGLDPATARKVDFYSRQFIDAMSPTNFLLTNPEVLRKTAETGGENLLRGLNNLLGDLERGRGSLSIKMTDMQAFSVGENIAVSPGKVVFRNALIELIQYEPTTPAVHRRPLVIFPPWINKFYILDLRPKNSFVRWAVGQGHTVFMVSWVNPDARLAEKDFEDYMAEGVFAALDAIERITEEREINAIGYCLGGTLLAASLAHMAAHGDDRVKSATFLVSLTDFADAGELGVFIDEEQLRALEEKMNRRGYLEGSEMATTFSMLRANDLIWGFVVNNYLLGNEPFPFDLLYWNADATRMPAKMHSFYLRNMYQKNLLAEPGGISLGGTPIDLSKVTVPVYFLSCREDHIAPWKSTYKATQLMSGSKRFVLAASGHIAGVVNPPEGGKYNHFINEALPETAEAWFQGAAEMAGSWWPDWQRWVLAQNGAQNGAETGARKSAQSKAARQAPGQPPGQAGEAGAATPARKPGARGRTYGEAPGAYVKVQVV